MAIPGPFRRLWEKFRPRPWYTPDRIPVGRLEPGAVPGGPPRPKRKVLRDAPVVESLPPGLCDVCHMTHAKWSATHFGLTVSFEFCNHHARKYRKALEDKGFELKRISDEAVT